MRKHVKGIFKLQKTIKSIIYNLCWFWKHVRAKKIQNEEEEEEEEANKKKKQKYCILKIIKITFHVVMAANWYAVINDIASLLNVTFAKK